MTITTRRLTRVDGEYFKHIIVYDAIDYTMRKDN
jgi:hypothetical protein